MFHYFQYKQESVIYVKLQNLFREFLYLGCDNYCKICGSSVINEAAYTYRVFIFMSDEHTCFISTSELKG